MNDGIIHIEIPYLELFALRGGDDTLLNLYIKGTCMAIKYFNTSGLNTNKIPINLNLDCGTYELNLLNSGSTEKKIDIWIQKMVDLIKDEFTKFMTFIDEMRADERAYQAVTAASKAQHLIITAKIP